MGLCGAFMTGDLFNLFVFFEVLLIAVLCAAGARPGPERFRVGVHYVVLNLSASALFLIGAGAGVRGDRHAEHGRRGAARGQLSGDAAVLASRRAAVAGGVWAEGGLVPLYFWLPATYAAASAPVARCSPS
jgi:multicomponent K+:H+ antiporter subunit D